MFKLDDNEETIIKNWPVIISIPQDGGGVQKQEISVDYLLLPQDQIDEIIGAEGYSDGDLLRIVVRRVTGVGDADGKALDYTPELLGRLIRKQYVRAAMVTTYFEAASGKKAKRKN